MRYIDKLCNFFISHYSNNSKFHHSKIGVLRILFERNTKLQATFASLGNVFRNSKWSDLKIQNIKPSFTKSWTNTALLFILLTFTFYTLIGPLNSGLVFRYVPLAYETYELLSYLWSGFDDSLRLSFALLGSISLRYANIASLSPVQANNPIYNTLNHLEPITHTLPVKLNNNSVVRGTPHWADVLTYKHLRAQSSIGLITSSRPTYCSEKLPLYPLESIGNGLDQTYIRRTPISKMEASWLLTPVSILREYDFDTRLASVARKSTQPHVGIISADNSTLALQSAKEDRWLLRNSLLTDGLITNSNAFTQSKKLLGINTLNSDSNDKNIWASSKLNAASNERGLDFIGHLQELFHNKAPYQYKLTTTNHFNAALANFDNFENSRIWLTKKYAFTNQLQSNLASPAFELAGPLPTGINTPHLGYILPTTTLFLVDAKTQLNYLSLGSLSSQYRGAYATEKTMFNIYMSLAGSTGLKSTNIVFLNNLVHSTPQIGLPYFTDTETVDDSQLRTHQLKFN